ncbi:MAG: anti-sigma factor [Spirochaetales bacterium]|nr:anti-sigma factor [Spirochaetales bacterium]
MRLSWFGPALILLLALLFSCSPENARSSSPALLLQGTAAFADKFAHDDAFFLQVSGVPALKSGQTYQGWLVGPKGILNLGVLSRSDEGKIALSWASPTGFDLVSAYTGFQATVEPAEGSSRPTGPIAFAGKILPLGVKLFSQNGEAPSAPAPGLQSQTDLASEHAGMAQAAAQLGNWNEMKAHLEHVVNILEGVHGSKYGDYLGTGVPQNPGDGWGARTYANNVAQLLTQDSVLSSDALNAEKNFQTDAEAVEKTCLTLLKNFKKSQIKTLLPALKTQITTLKTGPAAELYRLAAQTLSFTLETPS